MSINCPWLEGSTVKSKKYQDRYRGGSALEFNHPEYFSPQFIKGSIKPQQVKMYSGFLETHQNVRNRSGSQESKENIGGTWKSLLSEPIGLSNTVGIYGHGPKM